MPIGGHFWVLIDIKAHIAIACMAFARMRRVAYGIALQQNETMSPERIRHALAAR